MLSQLILFEIRYHSRQLLFRASALVFALLGFAMSQGRFGAGLPTNAAFTLGIYTGLLSLAGVMAASLLVPGAILRDRSFRTEAIVFSTNITRAQFLISRFIGVVIAALLVFLPATLGLVLGSFVSLGSGGSLAPFRLSPYLWSLVLIGWPNVLLAVSLLFTVAALTRSAMATYLAGVLLYVLYWIGSLVGNSPLMAGASPLSSQQVELAALLDPYALVAMMEQTRYWSVAEKTARLFPLEGILLSNRLLWLALALGMFALTYRIFSFRAPHQRSKTQPITVAEIPAVPIPAAGYAKRGFRRWWRAALAHGALHISALFRGYVFPLLMVLWIFFMGMTAFEGLQSIDLGMSYIASDGILMPALIRPLRAFGTLIVIFFSVETYWRERDCRMDGLINTTANPAGAFWFGKLLALCGLVVVLTLSAAAVAMVFQIQHGGSFGEWQAYLYLIPWAAVPLFMTAVLALLLLRIVPHKYGGMGLCFLIFVGFTGMVLANSPLLPHPALRFGYLPDLNLSPMAGRGYADDAGFVYLGYWLAWCLVLVAVTLALRGHETRWRIHRPGKTAWTLGISGLLLTAGLGWFIWLETSVPGAWQSRKATLQQQESYERQSLELAALPRPELRDLTLQVDLYPRQRRFFAKGEMIFQNSHDQPISALALWLDSRTQKRQLNMEGASIAFQQPRLGIYKLELDQPLSPGEQRRLDFSFTVKLSGFMAMDHEAYVLPAASYIEIDKWLPRFAPNRGHFIGDEAEREQRGLGPLPPLGAGGSKQQPRLNLWLMVSTDADQTVVAPGEPTVQTIQGRKLFNYWVREQVPLHMAIASAAYAKETTHLEGIPISLFYHPGHEANLASLLAGARDALQTYSQRFAPYPFDQLTIAEIPSFSDRFGATAYPETIYAVENRVFLLRQGAETPDLAYRAMAHEVAHQWWGNLVEPAVVPGFRLLTEVLSEYSEMVVYGATYGPAANREILIDLIDLYFFQRGFAGEPEQPLVLGESQFYATYFKGAQVVHALRELLGESIIDGVLSDLAQTAAYPAAPLPEDLVSRLEAVALEHLRPVIDEMFRQVVIHRVRLVDARIGADAAGEPQLVLDIRSEQVALSPDGSEVTGPMNRPLEIQWLREGRVVGSHSLAMTEVQEVVRLPLTDLPDRVVLDPRLLLLEADRRDNEAEVEIGGQGELKTGGD